MLTTYYPKAVTIAWNAIPINSGLAPDTFLSMSRSEDTFTKTVGADGTVARTRSADRTGEVEITLMQNSPVNLLLSTQAIVDENSDTADKINETTGGVVGISNITVVDLSGALVANANNCWIRKIPDQDLSKDYGERTWMFDCERIDMIAGV